jgi:hypothetical protein
MEAENSYCTAPGDVKCTEADRRLSICQERKRDAPHSLSFYYILVTVLQSSVVGAVCVRDSPQNDWKGL